MSRASGPRHSPTMIRSGRMRSELRTRSRIEMAPRPSTFCGFDSRLMTWTWRSRSSAASSHVTMRSVGGMNPESTFSSVVLPDPVPPETIMLSRVFTAASRYSRIASVAPPFVTMRPGADNLVEEDLDEALFVVRRDERRRRLGPEVVLGQLHEQAPDPRPVVDVNRRGVPAQQLRVDLSLRDGEGGTQ